MLTHREFDHEGVHDAPDDGDKVERVPAVLEVALPDMKYVPFKPY